MPKRKFEMIPTGYANPGLVADARTIRAFRRQYNALRVLVTYPNMSFFHQEAFRDIGAMTLMRRFGIHTDDDRQYFATMTGRSNSIIRSLRSMLDRRRRQAYLLLRRVLPIEVSQRILIMNSNSSVTNLLMRLGLVTPHNWHN
jgi:hypothetical protein